MATKWTYKLEQFVMICALIAAIIGTVFIAKGAFEFIMMYAGESSDTLKNLFRSGRQ